MRIALLGWDLDREAVGAVARLGADVVAFTRWFPDEPEREAHPGWLEVRCPHEIGGGPGEEAVAFGVGAVRAASNSGLGFDFDVVHAMDWRTRPAAVELASRGDGRVLVIASDRAEDEEADDLAEAPFAPDAWFCDHPWGAERRRARIGDGGARVASIPTQAGLGFWTDRRDPRDAPDEGPRVVVSLGRGARVSPRAIAEGLKRARGRAPGLIAAAFGVGPAAARLRRLLKAEGLLSARWGETIEPTTGRWNGAVSEAATLATGADALVDDPFARAAWLLGTPAVSVAGRAPDAIAGAILAGLFDRERREVDVRLGVALETRRVEPDGVAAAWLRAYRRLLGRRPAEPPPPPPAPVPFPELRSRLSLTPISPREAMASWSVRPDDWRVAMEWLGPEAVRAVLTIRLFDVTDVAFDGLNAHGASDVDVGPGETHRTIALPFDGRSLAACLGVRSRWGYFHPLTHCRICHLPREGLAPAPTPPARRLRVAPRRPGP
ncbi:DUF4912 domain-containing protein [Paludisphaera sp.]|uniref:DUF4912 domain-containing protein n=1 Tax=Paludisphaera sp. TaxID=2017432 RepID=UPI00301DCD1F